MKKTFLAVAIPAALLANSVAAVELYDDGKTSLAFGGHATAELTNSEAKKLKVTSNSPRINFTAKRDLGNGVTAEAKVEWGINSFTSSNNSDVFFNRLGYVALGSDYYGTVAVGQQWSVFYDVVGAADKTIIFANDYAYNDGNNLGTGRASDAITYRKGFDFGNAGELNVGLQWQSGETIDTTTYGSRSAAAITYSIAGVTAGYVLSQGNISGEEADIQAYSLGYGSFGNGIYAGATAAQYDAGASAGAFNVAADVDAYDAVISYGMKNGLTLSATYETAETSDTTLNEATALVGEYSLASNVTVYGGHEFDLEGDNDTTKAGVRFYF